MGTFVPTCRHLLRHKSTDRIQKRAKRSARYTTGFKSSFVMCSAVTENGWRWAVSSSELLKLPFASSLHWKLRHLTTSGVCPFLCSRAFHKLCAPERDSNSYSPD